MSQPDTAPRLVALSTTSVFPDRVRTPSRWRPPRLRRSRSDGPGRRQPDVTVLRQLMDYHGLPVLAVMRPALLDPSGCGAGIRGSWSGPRTWPSSSGRGWSWCIPHSAGNATTPGISRRAWPACGTRPTWCSRWRTCSRSGPGCGGGAVRAELEPGTDGLPERHPGSLAHRCVRFRRPRHGRGARQQAWLTCTWPTAPGWPTGTSTWCPAGGPSRARRCCASWPPPTIRA